MRPMTVLPANPLAALRLAALAGLACFLPGAAYAAGYDTPILYSARHMGMGGTAIGYVDDPSAIYHNPAGIAAQQAGALHLDFSPIMGTIKGTPSKDSGNIETNFSFSPAFLGGFAWRLHQYASAGVAVYPAASSGGGYSYTSKDGKTTTEDNAKLVFLEVAPTLASEILPGLRVGLSARMAQVTFQRKVVNTKADVDDVYIDMDMKGYAFTGIRAGVQYTRGPLDVGLVYRSGATAVVTADKATVTGIPAEDGKFSFILPSKMGLGLQYRGIKDLRLAADFEYIFNSENQITHVEGTAFGQAVTVPNYSRWQDSMTIRVGGAYKIGDLEPRLGYLLDTQAANKSYPSAFGSPPAPTHTATAGLGYDISKNLDVSFAAAYRAGGTTVTAEDVAKATAAKEICAFCGQPGEYALSLFGAYVDVRWRFGGSSAKASTPVAATPEPLPAAPEPAAPAPAAPEAAPAAPTPSPVAPETAPEAPKR